MEKRWRVSSNPHVRSKVTTNGIMMAVVLALLPPVGNCLLYTSDAADDLISVNIAGRRTIRTMIGVVVH